MSLWAAVMAPRKGIREGELSAIFKDSGVSQDANMSDLPSLKTSLTAFILELLISSTSRHASDWPICIER